MTTSSAPEMVGDPPAVLFVDDEESILAGLRSGLRRLRRTYRFHFAVGAAEAMELLEREPIDVVVTDMRMPGTNGVGLLRHVRDHYPNTIRYVLSGEAERELVVQAVPVAHRWLSKPCDRDDLAGALADAVRYRHVLADPAIAAAVAGADALPTPPALYLELQDLLADPDVAVGDVAALVATDPAISAKLLQWANSAFSGRARSTDLDTAIVRIGLATVSQLVLLAGVFRALEPADAVPGIDAAALRARATVTSAVAGALTRPSEAATAEIGGLFVDVGLLLEATLLPERLRSAYDHALDHDRTLIDAERELFGVTHPELGSYLLSIWGLPAELVLLVPCSHDLPPADVDPPLTAGEAVQAARLVAQRCPHAADLGRPHLDRLDPGLEAAVDRWLASSQGAGVLA